jgi:hypothetical protein
MDLLPKTGVAIDLVLPDSSAYLKIGMGSLTPEFLNS